MYKKDPSRENRIHSEIVVEAYDEGEVNTSWYYYFNEYMKFPFQAVVHLQKRNGTKEQVKVEVLNVQSEAEAPILFGIAEKGYDRLQMIVPNVIVSVIDAEESKEMLNDWLYYHRKPLIK
ncbi:MAG: calcium-binding protein [Bacteroidota bacterium]